MNNILSVWKSRLADFRSKNGILWVFARYMVLFGIGFVFLYPILYMVVNSLLSPDDLSDPSVFWIPTKLYWGNFAQAFETLDFFHSLLWSLAMSAVPALLQTASASLIAFGLARFQLPGRRLIFILIIATFIIPSQIVSIPKYVLFNNYGMLNTVFPSYLPAVFGQGLRSAVFILVFYQFFSSYPTSFDEAAELDGAGKAKIFFKISMPMASTAVVLSLLLSFVWYWNETTEANMMFGAVIKTLPLQLANFTARYEAIYGAADQTSTVNRLNESVSLAGTLLSILTLLIMYICLQRQFIESIERTGLTGE